MAATEYDFQATRNEVIERALRIVGALPLGEQMTAEQISAANFALNSMLKAWQRQHLHVWNYSEETLNLVDGDKDYTAPSSPAIIGISQAYLRDANSNDVPMTILSFSQYNTIPNKDTEGQPSHICIKSNGSSAATIYLWPVPNTAAAASYDVFYLGISKSKDWESSSSVGNFEEDYKEAIAYCLADSLADEYLLSIAERKHIQGKAYTKLKEIRQAFGDKGEAEFVRSAY